MLPSAPFAVTTTEPPRSYWESIRSVFRTLPRDNAVSLFDENTLTFTEWKPYTSPTTGKTGWVSSGGEVRYEDPRGTADAPAAGKATGEAWPAHPVAAKIKGDIAAAPIPAQHKAEYSAAASSVLSRIPALGHDRMMKHVGDGTAFYADSKALGVGVIDKALSGLKENDARRHNLNKQRAAAEAGKLVFGGAFLKAGKGSLHLDGGYGGADMPAGAHGGRAQSAAEVYAHEFTHGIDGPQHQISNSTRWLEAWDKEIGPESRQGAESRLCLYAEQDPSEGLAEFGRLVYGGVVPLDQVEKEFPIAAKFFRDAKLWPA